MNRRDIIEDHLIQAMYNRLTDKQKRRLMMYFDGMSYTNIAKEEGISLMSAKKSVVSAKKRIAKFIKGLERD